MKGTSIYLKSLDIKGIKTLNTNVTLSLTRKDECLPQWTVILGDNGIGKSTLLQAIAWLKPFLPYSVTDAPDNFIPEPIINDEENEVLEKLVSRHHQGTEPAYIKATFVANESLRQPLTKKKLQTCQTSITIKVDNKGKLEDVQTAVKTKEKDVFYKNEVVIYGYSASRQLGKLNLNDAKLKDTIPGFIKEKTVLYDAEEIYIH